MILGILWQYQQVALVRAAAVSQRKQEIAEVEAYNASVLQAQSAAPVSYTHLDVYKRQLQKLFHCHILLINPLHGNPREIMYKYSTSPGRLHLIFI